MMRNLDKMHRTRARAAVRVDVPIRALADAIFLWDQFMQVQTFAAALALVRCILSRFRVKFAFRANTLATA